MQNEITESQQTSQPVTGAEQTEDGVAKPAQKSLREQVKQQVRKFKLKINGNEREVDEKTLIALAQKGQGADQKFQQTAAERKRIKQFVAMAKSDPDALIKQLLGQDAVEFSKKRLARELQELSLDPKQKELRDLKKKLQAYDDEKKSSAQKAQKQAETKAVEHWTKHYDKVLPQAIKASGLPLTEDVIRHATDIMIANLEEGFDLPMEAVMELTRDRYLTSVKKFLGSADKEKLVELLGEQVVAKLGITKAKKAAIKQAVQHGSDSSPKPLKSQKENVREFQERMRKWAQE